MASVMSIGPGPGAGKPEPQPEPYPPPYPPLRPKLTWVSHRLFPGPEKCNADKSIDIGPPKMLGLPVTPGPAAPPNSPNPSPVKPRPMLSLGVSYRIDNIQGMGDTFEIVKYGEGSDDPPEPEPKPVDSGKRLVDAAEPGIVSLGPKPKPKPPPMPAPTQPKPLPGATRYSMELELGIVSLGPTPKPKPPPLQPVPNPQPRPPTRPRPNRSKAAYTEELDEIVGSLSPESLARLEPIQSAPKQGPRRVLFKPSPGVPKYFSESDVGLVRLPPKPHPKPLPMRPKPKPCRTKRGWMTQETGGSVGIVTLGPKPQPRPEPIPKPVPPPKEPKDSTLNDMTIPFCPKRVASLARC